MYKKFFQPSYTSIFDRRATNQSLNLKTERAMVQNVLHADEFQINSARGQLDPFNPQTLTYVGPGRRGKIT